MLSLASGQFESDRQEIVQSGAAKGIAKILEHHGTSLALVTVAAEAMRVLSLQVWKPSKLSGGVKKPTIRDIVLGLDLGAKPSPEVRKLSS